MIIKILGPGCANCVNLERVTRQAVADLGIDATFEKVTDYAAIAGYGVMRTPGWSSTRRSSSPDASPPSGRSRSSLAPWPAKGLEAPRPGPRGV